MNEREVRAALDILGEANIPPERLAAKLVEIAERYKALAASASTQAGDDPNTTALKAEAQRAIDDGQLDKADALLAQVETEQRRALDRFALGAAETAARRGEIALTRLRYGEAATRFADAAAAFPPNSDHEDQRIGYLEREADALYRQGDEFGDNAALASAIAREKRLLELNPRERVPLDWAATQISLGNALFSLGERESGTGKLEEAVAAYREALKEDTRERDPLDWAYSQHSLADALAAIAKRKRSSARMEEALACMRGAAEVYQQVGESDRLPAARSRITEMEAELTALKR